MTATPAANRTMRIGVAVTLAFVCMTMAARADEDPPPEPDGYWQGAMNGRVPATLAGGTVIGTDTLQDMLRTKSPLLIDVVPAPRQPEGDSGPWMPLPHRDIPNSVWIPGIGSGVISAEMTAYFRDRLAALTGHDPDKLMVFYCRPNCWASWNAAKRAIAQGYRHVFWYPDGVEAWQDAGLPTQIVAAEGPGVR